MTDAPRQHAATAHFPIADSPNKCADCVHFIKTSRPKKGRCLQWAKFMGSDYRFDPAWRMNHEDWWRGLPTISRETRACKYFVVRDA